MSTQNAYKQGNGLWLRGKCLYRGVLEWGLWATERGLCTTKIYLTVSISQEFRHSLVGASGGSHEAAIKVLPVTQGSAGEGLDSKPTHVITGNQFLVGCWTQGLGSLLAIGWRLSVLSSLPRGPLHGAPHNVASGFHQSEQVRRASERMTARGKSQSWSLSDIPSLWLYSIY